jgi:UDP-N-acetyl-D-mannosaminuronate dehydrogenase
MTTKPKVYLTGGEGQGWALDTDLRLANEVLENVVDLVEDESQADFIHTVCPEQICENLQYDKWKKNRRVIASFSNDPIALFEHVPELF